MGDTIYENPLEEFYSKGNIEHPSSNIKKISSLQYQLNNANLVLAFTDEEINVLKNRFGNIGTIKQSQLIEVVSSLLVRNYTTGIDLFDHSLKIELTQTIREVLKKHCRKVK